MAALLQHEVVEVVQREDMVGSEMVLERMIVLGVG